MDLFGHMATYDYGEVHVARRGPDGLPTVCGACGQPWLVRYPNQRAWLVQWLLQFLEACAALPGAFWQQHVPSLWSVALAFGGVAAAVLLLSLYMPLFELSSAVAAGDVVVRDSGAEKAAEQRFEAIAETLWNSEYYDADGQRHIVLGRFREVSRHGQQHGGGSCAYLSRPWHLHRLPDGEQPVRQRYFLQGGGGGDGRRGRKKG